EPAGPGPAAGARPGYAWSRGHDWPAWPAKLVLKREIWSTAMRRPVTTALAASAFACIALTAAAANPLEDLFGGLFNAQPVRPLSSTYYQSAAASPAAAAYAYAPEASRPASARIPRATVASYGNYASGTALVNT